MIAFQLTPDQSQAYYVLPNSQALKPSTYRFWIRAFNSLGQASSWSTAQTFVITASVDRESVRPETTMALDDVLLVSLIADHQDTIAERVQAEVSSTFPAAEHQTVNRIEEQDSADPGMRLVSDQPTDNSSTYVELIDTAFEKLFNPSLMIDNASILNEQI